MRLHAQLDGPADAPVLVLVGSVGSTIDMWDPVLAPLLEQYRVVRIDHRGHGGSQPAPAGMPCHISDLAADVLETLDAHGIGRASYAGLSLGAMVGMWIAAHRPERIARLAVLCTSAYLEPLQLWHDRADAVRAGGMGAIADAVVTRWIRPQLAARSQELVATLRAQVAGVDAESYAQCCGAIATMDLRPDLARIASPTMVVVGADDPATPLAHGEVIAQGVVGARLEIVAEASHVATYEQPGRIASLMLDHLRGGAGLARGYATRREVLGDAHVDRSIASTTPLSAPFQQFITRYAWGDVWSRDELTRRERSIATLAALVTLGAEHELAMHIRAARTNGLSDEEIVEVLLHTSVYAGVPRANRAIAIAQEVLEH